MIRLLKMQRDCLKKKEKVLIKKELIDMGKITQEFLDEFKVVKEK